MGIRADLALAESGLAESRSKAKELIKSGNVCYFGKPLSKASEIIEDLSQLELIGNFCRYVSRGGLKLEKAIEHFGIYVTEKNCLDIGASTGGFCDCLLQNGADYVYALDCGHGQLSQKLVNSKKIKNIEGVNARYILPEDFDRTIDLVTCDASFISLTLLLPAMKEVCKEGGEIVCLIKPQFESGKEALNKKGVVKEEKDRKKAVDKIVNFANDIGLKVIGITESPIKGPEGNTEYLLYLKKGELP